MDHKALAEGKPAGNSNSPFLRLPPQHPTLQKANVLNYRVR